jgi:hypothetical protein
MIFRISEYFQGIVNDGDPDHAKKRTVFQRENDEHLAGEKGLVSFFVSKKEIQAIRYL